MYLEKPKRPIIWNKGWNVFTGTSILACKFACRSSFHSCLMFKLQAFIFSSSMCNSVVWEDNVYTRYLYLSTLLISLVIWLALVMLPYVCKGGNSLFFFAPFYSTIIFSGTHPWWIVYLLNGDQVSSELNYSYSVNYFQVWEQQMIEKYAEGM